MPDRWLEIRSAQLPALAPATPSFRGRACEHLRRHFPEATAALGDRALSVLVDDGTRRAMHYGFVSERDVCKFLNLMFTFGRHFDQDPRQAWARPFLEAAATSTPTLQMVRLCEHAREHVDGALGLEAGYTPSEGTR